MRVQRTHHNSSTQYLMAALITLVVGAGVLGFGVYIIEKAEMSVVKYKLQLSRKISKHKKVLLTSIVLFASLSNGCFLPLQSNEAH